MTLALDQNGAQRIECALDTAQLAALEACLPGGEGASPGQRLRGIPELNAFLASAGPIGAVAATRLGNDCLPVRAIVLDKSEQANWSLGWHQDRTIAVKARADAPGFRNWTRKAGILHVEPPFALLERMLTLRLHLDPVDVDNAPLLIAPGSHRLGRVAETELTDAVERCGVHACLAAAGDVWIYATPILHASDRAKHPRRRRVLQVDYSADALPQGLDWAGL